MSGIYDDEKRERVMEESVIATIMATSLTADSELRRDLAHLGFAHGAVVVVGARSIVEAFVLAPQFAELRGFAECPDHVRRVVAVVVLLQ